MSARGLAKGLVAPTPPLDFSCNLEREMCRGLDRRLHVYAVAHMLWKPLFGLYGHPLPGGIVSDFFRPKVQDIVDAACAPDPNDRPPIADLKHALLALVRGEVPAYFVPQNSDVRQFVKLRDRHERYLTGEVPRNTTRWNGAVDGVDKETAAAIAMPDHKHAKDDSPVSRVAR